MDPVELLMRISERAFWHGQKMRELRREQKPGEFFDRLTDEEKSVLRTLTSNDLKRVRPDAVSWMIE